MRPILSIPACLAIILEEAGEEAVLFGFLFEMPEKLRRMHPDLYRELTKFYAVDPASWRDARHDGGRPLVRESQGAQDKTTDAAE